MKRWHQERDLMLHRWRQEIASHVGWSFGSKAGYAYCALAPLPPTGEEKCHCYRGPGFMRKRTPFGCSNPRCGICHYEKYLPKNRGKVRREAIRFDLEVANGEMGPTY